MPEARKDRVRERCLGLRAPGALHAALVEAWRAWDPREPAPSDARILQTHYVPRKRGRLLAEITATDRKGRTRSQFLYLQVYRTKRLARRRASAVFARRPLNCVGPPLLYLHEFRAVVWALPNGPRLRSARVGFTRKRFHKFLAQCGIVEGDPPEGTAAPDLVRYVPRRRALFLHNSIANAPIYVKVFAPGGDMALASNLLSLDAARDRGDIAFGVPALLAHGVRRRAVVMSCVPGTPLTRVMATCPETTWAAAGHAVAELHASDIEPEMRWTLDAQVAALAEAIADLRIAHPEQTDAIDHVEGELRRMAGELPAPRLRPVHGNLFGDQMLVADGSIGMVDWDDLCVGDPAFDLGRLTAHVLFEGARHDRFDSAQRCCATLIAAHAERAPGLVDATRLRWHTAACLMERAKISALRPIAETWVRDIDRATEHARAILHRMPVWLDVQMIGAGHQGEERCA